MGMNLLAQFALVMGIVVGVNIPASLVGIDFADEGPSSVPWSPPGWVIQAAWTLLFALLAIARARLLQVGASDQAKATLCLIVLCATYAWTTLGLARLTGWSPLVLGLIVNLLVILGSALLARAASDTDTIAAGFIWPVTAWTVFATLLIAAELRLAAN